MLVEVFPVLFSFSFFLFSLFSTAALHYVLSYVSRINRVRIVKLDLVT